MIVEVEGEVDGLFKFIKMFKKKEGGNQDE